MAKVNLINNNNPNRLKKGATTTIDNLLVNLDNSITVQSKNAGTSIIVPGTSAETITGAKSFSVPINLFTSAVTQTTSLGTSVTAHSQTGIITMASGALAPSGGTTAFTVYNSYVTTSSKVLLTAQSGAMTGIPYLTLSGVNNGSFIVNVHNIGGAAFNSSFKTNFFINA